MAHELSPGLCDNLEGWDGVGEGREVQEGGDRGIPMADSCWRMAETNTTLQSNYPPIRNKQIKLRKHNGEGKEPGLSTGMPGPVQSGILSLTLESSRKFCGRVRVIAEVRIILGKLRADKCNNRS